MSTLRYLCLPLLVLFGQVFASPTDTLHVKNLMDSAGVYLYNDPEKAGAFVQEAIGYAQARQLPVWEANATNFMGSVLWAQGKYPEALERYRQAGRQYEVLGNEYGVARAANNLGLVYQAMGHLEMALRHYSEALPYFDAHGTGAQKATLYNNIGIVHKKRGELELAVQYFDQAMEWIRQLEEQRDTAMVHNNLAVIHRELGDMDKSRFHQELALSGYRSQNHVSGLINALTNYGGWLMVHERYEEADSLYAEALALTDNFPNAALKSLVWLKYAEQAYRKGEFRESMAAGDSTLHYLRGESDNEVKLATLEVKAMAHHRAGDHAASYDYLARAYKLRDTILDQEKVRSMAELTMKYETELKDQEIETLKQKEILHQWQQTGLIIGIGFLLLVAGLVFWRQRTRLQREKLLQEKTREAALARQAQSEAELKAAELQKLQLEKSIEFKSKELSNLAMGIIRQHELLRSLDEDLRKIHKKAPEKIRQDLRELSVLVRGQFNAEKERQELQMYLESAQQEFFRVLDQRFPQLTSRERRLCALIRMGYSSKEIAALFDIAPSSVDMGRYRLRKKLDPDMEVTLNDFLLQMEKELIS